MLELQCIRFNEKVELLCWPCLACQVVFELKGRIALQAGHALPIKWCLKEKVLQGKLSAIAMLELQRIRFAGWGLTEGEHRPKAGKKKKTREAGLFFLVPTSQVILHPKWVKKPFPDL